MKVKDTIILLSLVLAGIGVQGQEILTGLQFNETVREQYEVIETEKKACNCEDQMSEALQLPFLEDFSTSSGYPDENKWQNSRSVFINKDFPKFPPNLSAATFDAIDSTGAVYSEATWIPFLADELRSKPIRLDSVFNPVARKLSPADSIYLSFFYQPQGNGDAPEPNDTLVLEFARRGDTVFQRIDSISVSAQFYLSSPDDTIKPGDTLSPPLELGCDTSFHWVNYSMYTWDDFLLVPCDSVFGPEITWEQKWHAEGAVLDTFYKYNGGRYFVQVMVPLYQNPDDTVYFTDSFQFRFRNYASIANDIIPTWKSNVDQWNIDYIYLNYNRSFDDTTYRVLGFTNRAPSFLKNYQAMPYRQYRSDPTNALNTDFDMDISNLDKIEHNSNYRYSVEQVNGDFSYAFNGGNFNLPVGNYTNTEFVQKLFNVDFTTDTTSYLIRHYISDSSESNILVDSAVYRQGFYNYYAYDDGTPEFGYGIEPAGALMAYQFKLSTPDTIRGVQMYFNKTLNDANTNFFNLMVWKDNNGLPGEEVYVINSVKPRWEEGLYEFYTYEFDEPFMMSGTFYVGWQQLTQGSLNIGFDANNYYGYPRVFYKTEQQWVSSGFQGSLLIRPLVGPDMILSGMGDENIPAMDEQLLIYPNPSNGWFSIKHTLVKQGSPLHLEIFNLMGERVISSSFTGNPVNVDFLDKGLYIVRLTGIEKPLSGKLLISR